MNCFRDFPLLLLVTTILQICHSYPLSSDGNKLIEILTENFTIASNGSTLEPNQTIEVDFEIRKLPRQNTGAAGGGGDAIGSFVSGVAEALVGVGSSVFSEDFQLGTLIAESSQIIPGDTGETVGDVLGQVSEPLNSVFTNPLQSLNQYFQDRRTTRAPVRRRTTTPKPTEPPGPEVSYIYLVGNGNGGTAAIAGGSNPQENAIIQSVLNSQGLIGAGGGASSQTFAIQQTGPNSGVAQLVNLQQPQQQGGQNFQQFPNKQGINQNFGSPQQEGSNSPGFSNRPSFPNQQQGSNRPAFSNQQGAQGFPSNNPGGVNAQGFQNNQGNFNGQRFPNNQGNANGQRFPNNQGGIPNGQGFPNHQGVSNGQGFPNNQGNANGQGFSNNQGNLNGQRPNNQANSNSQRPNNQANSNGQRFPNNQGGPNGQGFSNNQGSANGQGFSNNQGNSNGQRYPNSPGNSNSQGLSNSQGNSNGQRFPSPQGNGNRPAFSNNQGNQNNVNNNIGQNTQALENQAGFSNNKVNSNRPSENDPSVVDSHEFLPEQNAARPVFPGRPVSNNQIGQIFANGQPSRPVKSPFEDDEADAVNNQPKPIQHTKFKYKVSSNPAPPLVSNTPFDPNSVDNANSPDDSNFISENGNNQQTGGIDNGPPTSNNNPENSNSQTFETGSLEPAPVQATQSRPTNSGGSQPSSNPIFPNTPTFVKQPDPANISVQVVQQQATESSTEASAPAATSESEDEDDDDEEETESPNVISRRNEISTRKS